MFLIYEVNYLMYGDVDRVYEFDMALYANKEDALKDIQRRKELYIENDNGFTFMEDESTENCLVFADNLEKNGYDREGGFEIRLVELKVN